VNLIGLAKGAQLAAAASAIALARRRAEHIPAAVALVLLAAIDVARGPLSAAGRRAAPIFLYVDGAAELGTYATVAGLCLTVALPAKHRARVVAGAVVLWALTSIALACAYPSPLVTGEGLQRVLFGADLLGLFVSSIALWRWMVDGIAARRSPSSSSMVALALFALDGAILLAPFSPWRGTVFGSDFSGIAVIVTAFFATFTIVQVILWKFSPG
jgi:hypothetical protein